MGFLSSLKNQDAQDQPRDEFHSKKNQETSYVNFNKFFSPFLLLEIFFSKSVIHSMLVLTGVSVKPIKCTNS